MEFESLLAEFVHKLMAKYGMEQTVTKIALDPRLFDEVIYELSKSSYGMFPRLSDIGDFSLRGIKIVARKKDDF